MKKNRAMCMISSFVTGFVGCIKRRTEPWQSLTYHVTSSVLAEGCHFSLRRTEGGGMTVTGYCFADGSEKHVKEPRAVSPEAVDIIGALELDKAVTERQKLFGMADGTKQTVTLGYTDGTQRKIRLSLQQHKKLKQLLQWELVGL